MPISAKTIGSLCKDDSDGSENVNIKKFSVFSKFFAIISTRLKCQMQVNFPEMEFFETEPNFTSTKETLSRCVYVLHKSAREGISSCSGKEMNKKVYFG